MAEELQPLHWMVDTPQLIKEMVEGNPHGGVLKIPATIFLRVLAALAERAIELDDPALNVLMLRLNLYDVKHDDLLEQLRLQRERLK